MPFFSIVIPVYNRADFIAATIDSVLSQKFDDYELIIVNDGSTDDSEVIIKNIAKENDKIKYLWQINSERGAARNHGFRNALGKYVIFLDSDDLMSCDHLTILYQKITDQDFPNFITTKYLLRRKGIDSYSIILVNLKEDYYDNNLLLKGAAFACNFIVKKNNLNLKLFPEERKYASIEDWMFIVQNLERDKIYLIDASTIIMNDHDSRSMRGDNQDIIKKHLLATHWIEKNIQLTTVQKRILWGYSYHFCAIHSYVDGRLIDTFKYIWKSILLVGLDKAKISLMLKSIISYKIIQRLNDKR